MGEKTHGSMAKCEGSALDGTAVGDIPESSVPEGISPEVAGSASAWLKGFLSQHAGFNLASRVAEVCSSGGTAWWVVVDFVEFHLMNSYYGYASGNSLLARLERFLRDLPQAVVVAHLFADKFVVLLADKDLSSNAEVGAFLRGQGERFRVANQVDFPLYHMRLRYGVCRCADELTYLDIDHASFARRTLVGQREECLAFYVPSMLELELKRDENEHEIIRALEDGEFTFYLQPKVDLHTGKIVGAEALARRIMPDGSITLPETFLPAMEYTGCVVDLDCLILEQACIHQEERLRRGEFVLPIAVNLSRLHVRHPEEAKRLEAIVDRHKVPRQLISFELTETVPLDDYSQAMGLIEELQGYGYLVAGDDFGSGYNSTLLWSELEFDVLKLDRKFLSEHGDKSERLDALAASTVLFANKLGISVVCEGVESADDCFHLIQWDCPVAQGFFFSEPVEPDAFYRILAEQNGYFDVSFLDSPDKYSVTTRRLSDQLTVKEILLDCLKVLSGEQDFDKAFSLFLERLGRYYRADRAYIFEFDLENQLADNTCEWCAPGISSEKDALQGIPLSAIGRWIELFTRHDRVFIGSLEELDKDSLEYAILKPQGIEALMAAPLYEGGDIVGFLGVDNPSCYQNDLSLLSASTDFVIEELRKREMIDRLEYASYVDMLTGLGNRNRYMDTLRDLEGRSPETLGVVFADVNRMKAANDTYGHEYGDKLLKLAAGCLKSLDAGRAYRIGGDEFVVLCCDLPESEFEAEVAKLRAAFAAEPLCDISVGSAWAQGDYDLTELTARADQRMYAEKQRSRCRCD